MPWYRGTPHVSKSEQSVVFFLQPMVPFGLGVMPFGVDAALVPFADCRRLAGSAFTCESGKPVSLIPILACIANQGAFRLSFAARSRTSKPVSEKLRLLFEASTAFCAGGAFFLGRAGGVSPSTNTSGGSAKLGKLAFNQFARR